MGVIPRWLLFIVLLAEVVAALLAQLEELVVRVVVQAKTKTQPQQQEMLDLIVR
jgi:hypothetical protein